uniref:Catalase core domain-containing protein n=1 Tax=Solanum lycopersicum TaxID=4081 RepID=A0A3Q7EP36_SOLLC
MDPDHEDRFDFDPLDVTKTWPDDILPLQPVGRLVLNKNTDNFFNENEQLAFCPSIVVPGVYYSDEKMLQTRIFIYSDTLRYRLGLNYCNFLLMLQSVLITAITMMALSILCTGMRRSATSVQGMIKFAMLRCILFLQQSAVVNERSVSFRNRTILSKQEKGTPQFIRHFIRRWVEAFSDPRITFEIRNTWISFWSQVSIPSAKQALKMSLSRDHDGDNIN